MSLLSFASLGWLASALWLVWVGLAFLTIVAFIKWLFKPINLENQLSNKEKIDKNNKPDKKNKNYSVQL